MYRMSNIYIFLIPLTAIFSYFILHSVWRKFDLHFRIWPLLIFPLGLFSIGFLFRLSEDPNLINIGHFFTEFTYVVL